MFASRGFRLTSLFACVLMAITIIGVSQAEARRGGSFGSRGMRTFQTAPATPTSPNITAPVQRSVTPATPSANSTVGASAAQRSFGSGLGGSLMRGVLLGGLFGLFLGHGFGGFAGFFGLILQLVLLAFIARWIFGALSRRTATAGGPSLGGGLGLGNGASTRTGSTRPRTPRNRDELGTTQRDLDRFEQLLGEIQDAYGREDYSGLRQRTTPEMMSYLSEELGQNASQGLRNEVSGTRLLRGDISESWREGSREYATAAMRYESVDVTRDRATGRVVQGDADRATETVELWTFVRERGGDWKLSAIQEA
jgi:predicted lipid-binding transport protein (Tim44 family)